MTDSPSATSVSTPTDGGLHLHKRRRTEDPASDRDDSSRADPEGGETEMADVSANGAAGTIANGADLSRTIALSEPPQWQRVIEKTVKAIVSIRFSQVSAFDTEGKEKKNEYVCFVFLETFSDIVQLERRSKIFAPFKSCAQDAHYR